MDTLKFHKSGVKVIAHRGLSGIEKENTNAAFVAAGNRSYWGIETDIHKTADGIFAVIHDNTTGRVAKRDIPVEESTFEELSSLVLDDIDGSTERCDLKIPTLNEYIRICKRYNKIAVLELKSCFSLQDLKRIITIIEENEYLKNTVFISFRIDNLIALRTICPGQKAQFLTSDFSDETLNILIKNKLDLDIEYTKLTAEDVHRLKENDIEVNVWTCNDAETAEKLVKYGVDYITTNILE